MMNHEPKVQIDAKAMAKLEEFVPKTVLGEKLLELAKKGVQESVARIDAEAILEELGRKKYKNSDVR